eukprot:CAMPEP_0114994536 /NCGR_PEP_ID=MMETSP0216-20121206/13194_1 /TAXON_ID=223996 /ORGANISM="Protocruzia adherens, Strain Boccale" /LENGTH=307 /DNA_ID=CAMNT_0002358409 /DNA_START=32 /DNA_END=955 /DNA_ORIENTATION=-
MEAKEGYYTLNNGNKIPQIALGTWQSRDDDVEKAVVAAIDAGYRAIDTAPVYGNEPSIGKALKECFESGKVTREEIFITTKVWSNNKRAADVRKSCQKSLEDLGLDYIDLLHIHWPWCGDINFAEKKMDMEYVPLSETWGAFEQLVEDGLVKNIGLSNFNVQLILDLVSYAKIKPAVLQVEIHPYYPQTDLVNWCATQRILVEAYCPLGLGSVPGAPVPDLKKLIEREEITEIASRLGKTPAQVILSWGLTRGTRVLPKSSNPTRLAENLQAGSFRLSKEDMDKIDAIPERGMYYDIFTRFGLPIFS